MTRIIETKKRGRGTLMTIPTLEFPDFIHNDLWIEYRGSHSANEELHPDFSLDEGGFPYRTHRYTSHCVLNLFI